jgi:hypothetical protein
MPLQFFMGLGKLDRHITFAHGTNQPILLCSSPLIGSMLLALSTAGELTSRETG